MLPSGGSKTAERGALILWHTFEKQTYRNENSGRNIVDDNIRRTAALTQQSVVLYQSEYFKANVEFCRTEPNDCYRNRSICPTPIAAHNCLPPPTAAHILRASTGVALCFRPTYIQSDTGAVFPPVPAADNTADRVTDRVTRVTEKSAAPILHKGCACHVTQ